MNFITFEVYHNILDLSIDICYALVSLKYLEMVLIGCQKSYLLGFVVTN